MAMFAKNTDYGVRALVCIYSNTKKHGEYISSAKISKQTAIPLRYLRRLIGQLVYKKYLIVKEGIYGGVKLAKKPHLIKISDLIELFQGRIEISKCMFRKKICKNRKTCVLRKHITRIEKKVTDEFAKLTLQKLIDDLNKTKREEK